MNLVSASARLQPDLPPIIVAGCGTAAGELCEFYRAGDGHSIFSASLLALLSLFLVGCHADVTTVFSSRVSPDGSLVAESVMIGDGEAGGELVIRARDGSKWHVDFAETAPDLFLRWSDNQTLEVWRERHEQQKPTLGYVSSLGDVRVVWRSFDFPNDVASAYSRTGLNTRHVAVPAGKVAAAFASSTNGQEQHCILTIGTAPDPTYDTAKVEITGGSTRRAAEAEPVPPESPPVSLSMTIVARALR